LRLKETTRVEGPVGLLLVTSIEMRRRQIMAEKAAPAAGAKQKRPAAAKKPAAKAKAPKAIPAAKPPSDKAQISAAAKAEHKQKHTPSTLTGVVAQGITQRKSKTVGGFLALLLPITLVIDGAAALGKISGAKPAPLKPKP
jgi:sRNA-binding protein